MRQCPQCKRDYVPTSRRRWYCSQDCRLAFLASKRNPAVRCPTCRRRLARGLAACPVDCFPAFDGRGKATPEYGAWRNIIQRCTNRRAKSWKDYGGRGIQVCQAWMADYQAFRAHVGPRPTPGHSIDRIDNWRGYEPGNVRWATGSEQGKNRRPRKKRA